MLNEIDSATTKEEVEEWQLEQHTLLLLLYSENFVPCREYHTWICSCFVDLTVKGHRAEEQRQFNALTLGSGGQVYINSFGLDWLGPRCRV